MKKVLLKHYTNIGNLRLILQNGFFLTDCLGAGTKEWEDQNDVELLQMYHQKANKYPYALCFTTSSSIHHWSYYGRKSYNKKVEKFDKVKCCICIDYHKLEKCKNEKKLNDGIQLYFEKVDYKSLHFLKNNQYFIRHDQIPFVKRKGYSVDNEYRLLLVSDRQLDDNSTERYFSEAIPHISCVRFYVSPNEKHNNITADEIRKYLKKLLNKSTRIEESSISYSQKWTREIVHHLK